jgi:hypothetical protein
MTHYEVTSLLLVIISVILIPALMLLVKVSGKWTQMSDDIKHLVDNNDAAHREIMKQMSLDREVTNKRIRWFEEYFMRHGMMR